MRAILGLAAAAVAGFVHAHPGHGAPEGHFHSVGWEAMVFAAAAGLVALLVTRDR